MTAAQTQEAPVVTSKSGGDNKFTKIALITLAVVFLIIISEVAYLIFAKRGDSIFNIDKTVQQEEGVRTIVNIPPQPTGPLAQEKQKEIVINSDKVRAFADIFDFLFSNDMLESSDKATIDIKLSGVVSISDFDNEEINGINYVYRLHFERQNGSVIVYNFTEEEVTNAQVFLYFDLKRDEVSLTDIKPGDAIIIMETIDLFDANPYSSIILEITRQR
jgi:hypothetical protein